jgi:hypothetical protein
VLLTIPVVMEIPAEKSSNQVLAKVSTELSPFAVERHSVRLNEKSAIAFDGIVEEIDEGQASVLGIAIRGRKARGFRVVVKRDEAPAIRDLITL